MRELDAVLLSVPRCRTRRRLTRQKSRAFEPILELPDPRCCTLPCGAQCPADVPTRALSSNAFAPALDLRPSASRLRAAVVVGAARTARRSRPCSLRPVAGSRLAALARAGRLMRALRRPRRMPTAADHRRGRPMSQSRTGARATCRSAPRTLVRSCWVRLDLGIGPRRHDIVLLADQTRSAADWARLARELRSERAAAERRASRSRRRPAGTDLS